MLDRLLMVCLIVGMVGCGGGTPPSEAVRIVTDDLGREVLVKLPIERVVTLAPSLTETVFAAGAGHKLVGANSADNYPPAVDTLPRFGVFPINYEAIAALEPDLVLASDQINDPRDAETFAALRIPTVFLSSGNLDEVIRGLRTVGDLLGTDVHAEAAADSLEQTIATLRARTASAAERPLVLFLIGDDRLFSFGPESYIHTLIDLAGGRSATASLSTINPVLSEEFVLTAKPEVIVGTFGTDYDPAQLLVHHPTWTIVPAVAEGRVYSFHPDLFLRPGPRLIEGAQRMAGRLHPALFAPPTASE